MKSKNLVITLIVLVVLVVVVVIFSSKFQGFSQATGSCNAKGGTCYSDEKCPRGTTSVIGGGNCKETKEICCVNIEGKE